MDERAVKRALKLLYDYEGLSAADESADWQSEMICANPGGRYFQGDPPYTFQGMPRKVRKIAPEAKREFLEERAKLK